MEMLVMVSGTLWPLVSMTFCAALVVWRTWFPNAKLAGDNVTDVAAHACAVARRQTSRNSCPAALRERMLFPR